MCRSETGERKKKARGGQWEGERSEEAAAFPSFIIHHTLAVFIDYCYFYWNIHREPLRRREEQQHAQWEREM